MSKVRVYELAKQFGMKGPELAELCRRLGFEKIKSHMAVLDEADQMMVVGSLEAQGLTRSTEEEAPARPGKKSLPKKKSLPGKPTKKSLPPPLAGQEPAKKKLPGDGGVEMEVEAVAEEVAETAPETAAAHAQAPEVEEAPPVEQPEAVETTHAEPEVQEPAVAETPAEPAAPAEPPSAETAEQPEAGEMAAEATAAAPQDAAQPEAATAPEVTAEGAPEGAQEAAAETTAEAPAEATGGDESEEAKQVKRLLVPRAKAQVVGRIELPQETIRDATRRSAPTSDKEADRKLRRMALQSTQSRTAARGTGTRRGPGAGGRGRGRDGRPGHRKSRINAPTPTVDPNKIVEIEPPTSLKNLSEALGIKVNELLATLQFRLDVKGKTINSFLSPEEVELVALELKRNIKIVEHKEAEEELLQNIVKEGEEEEEYSRAPVLTFMGHVDHGKTTLLDALRESDVVKGEAGGITQHIGAYRVTHSSGNTFVVLDTPGHAAFTSMRARGANLTDIVVLVVAADDGVMPQTEEALAHAKDAKVPIVVAVNKCDRPNANPMQVRQQLSIKGLQPEEWGGDVQLIDVSATTGDGLNDLVEQIMLQAEILELSAKPSAPGAGTVIESKQTPEQGVVVNVLVTNGTLRVKDRILCGDSLSRIRAMTDDHGRQVDEAGPSTPVTIIGIDELPQPGDHLFVISDVKKAKEVVEDRQRRSRDLSLAERSSVTLENLSAHLAAAKSEEIKVILKADVMGSLEPIKQVLADINTEEVRVNIIHAALGGITEADVGLAEAGGAVIIGFNSVPDQSARQAAERAGVSIKFYDVIYTLIDEMKLALEGLLAPEEVEKVTGHAEVRAVFRSSKFGNIAGCYVLDGIIQRNNRVRVSRDGAVVHSGTVAGLRRIKDDVREVKAGFECGVTLNNFNDVKVGDQIESYTVEHIKRTL